MVPKTNDEICVSISIGKQFSSVFCIAPKKVSLLKIQNVRQPLEKSLPLCKGGRKCKKRFFNQRLLHPVVFQKRELQIFRSSFASCSLQWRGWLHYECVRISILKYCQYHNGHLLAFRKTAIKSLKQGVKFVQT